MPTDSLAGRWLWMELLTPEPEASAVFYSRVFGWGTELFRGAGLPYTIFTANGSPIGGLLRLPNLVPPEASWIGYLGVPDVDAAVERALALGGRIHRPATDVPTVGRFAVLADPFGASFAVYRPLSGTATGVESPAVGDFAWYELSTDDVDRAFDFYSQITGWKRGPAHDLGLFGPYQIYSRERLPLGGIYARSPAGPTPSWLSYVRVAELEPALGRVRAAGGRIVQAAQEVPGGDRVATCADPQGARFALQEVTRA